ncbi:FUSC family protein [Mycetocola reblochoni]|uniref:Integral membrane protein n=2 Tax=Mycetocola reblochoni TaxID=331618 RepID=A0A1R4JEE0_9MICO|nr:aromatic acid exporter family protein [Mycetocola reblochoni]RLP69911.1 FUSC family protein [Mycetocola reblochoni]SJN30304.1 Integral membrane protein [Mycetocola reblochoni REB411]
MRLGRLFRPASVVSARLRAPARVPFLQVAKTGVAVTLSWVVAGLVVPGQAPIFAAIAALLVVQPSVNQSYARALERSAGVILGVVLAMTASQLFGDNSTVILLSVVACLLLAWLLKLTPGSSNQIPISAMLVLSLGSTTPGYAWDRIVESIIGAAVAVLVNLAIAPPLQIAPVRADVVRLGSALADSLEGLAALLPTRPGTERITELMIQARLLRPMRTRLQNDLIAAADSLRLNPRQARYRAELEQIEGLSERLNTVVNRVIGMTRAYQDHYDDDLASEPTIPSIIGELRRAAHDIRLLTGDPDADDTASIALATEPPALTAPLVVLSPSATHWVLIGSLLEDLRRIHDEVVGER